MHVLPPYQEDVAYPVADEWAPRGISLPTHQLLTVDDVDRIASSVEKALVT
jgi:perosamine synthetase